MNDFKKNFTNLKSFFGTDSILYPLGHYSIKYINYIPLLFSNFLSPNYVININIAFILSFIITFIGTYYLALSYGLNRFSSIAVATIFTFCPIKFVHFIGHYFFVLTFAIPFYILCFNKTFKEYKLDLKIINYKYLFLSLIFFILTFISSMYLAYYLIIYSLTFIVYQFFIKDYNLDKKFFKNFIITSFISVIISTALMLFFHFILKLESHFFNHSTEFLSLFVKYPFIEKLNFLNKYIHFETITYIGIFNIIFFLFFIINFNLWKNDTKIKFFLFVNFIFLLFVFPVFKITGKALFATPSVLFYFMPGIQYFRCSGRVSIMLMLFLPILLFYFLERFKLYKIKKIYQIIFYIIVLIIIIFDFYPGKLSFRKKDDLINPTSILLKDMPDGTLIEFPFGIGDGYVTYGYSGEYSLTIRIYNQIFHNKKMIGAYTDGQLKKQTIEFFFTNAIISNINLMQYEITNSLVPITRDEKNIFFNTFNVKYLLIYPDLYGKTVYNYILDLFKNETTNIIITNNFTLLLLDKEKVQ